MMSCLGVLNLVNRFYANIKHKNQVCVENIPCVKINNIGIGAIGQIYETIDATMSCR